MLPIVSQDKSCFRLPIEGLQLILFAPLRIGLLTFGKLWRVDVKINDIFDNRLVPDFYGDNNRAVMRSSLMMTTLQCS